MAEPAGPSPAAAADQRYRDMRRVTVVGAAANTLLALGKIVLGVIGHSEALVADGVHSLADLISDAVVLFAAKQSAREADAEHPYGHGRIETVVTVALGIFLIAVAAIIGHDAVFRILEPEHLTTPSWFTLVAALFSIAAKEWLYHYTVRTGKRINSKLLIANAWHHRTDAISSIIALAGIAGAMLGFPMFDALAAIGVSLMIAKVGWDISWSSLRELIDTALDEDQVARIRATILAVDGVRAAHSLRTRSMGGRALVDVHILVDDPRISVSEGHQIGEAVRHKLLREIDHVTDVIVHIDQEDDELAAPSSHLPLRAQLLAQLHRHWRNHPFHEHIKRITLHYLGGKIEVEILLPLDWLEQKQHIEEILDTISQGEDDIARIHLAFE